KDSERRFAIVLRICDTFSSLYFSSPTNCGIVAALLAFVDTSSVCFFSGTKFSTSLFTILPPVADPLTSRRSIPFSFAIFLANGEALILESSESDEEVVSEVDFSSDFGSLLFLSSFFPSDFPPSDFAFDCACFNKGSISVPSGPTIAITPFTGTDSPSFGPIYKSVPSAYAVTSILALSVSTSAIASSDAIVSPTSKFQLDITPSVIVSLKSGIVITVTSKSSALTEESPSSVSATLSSSADSSVDFSISSSEPLVSALPDSCSFNKSSYSSPSSPNIAITAFTGTASPSFGPI